MHSIEKVNNGVGRKKLVLAPGAADAAEGLVYLNGNNAPCRCVAGAILGSEKSDIKDPSSAEKQSDDGFWSVAPGCGDVSEGMVRVPAKQKKLASAPHAAI